MSGPLAHGRSSTKATLSLCHSSQLSVWPSDFWGGTRRVGGYWRDLFPGSFARTRPSKLESEAPILLGLGKDKPAMDRVERVVEVVQVVEVGGQSLRVTWPKTFGLLFTRKGLPKGRQTFFQTLETFFTP